MESSLNDRADLAIDAASDQELTDLTLAQASARIQIHGVSSTLLTAATLRRIDAIDSKLNSYITVTGQDALAQAKRMDEERQDGFLRGPLHGVPIAVKDNIDTAGVPTTAGSGVFQNRIPHEDATVISRLRAAGAIIVGKLNLHEFAAGGTGHVSAFGPTHNPWDLHRVTGGSSSGSGGAVAGRLCFGALGTDTGGSVRIPSSWCGVTGLKPTYGLVPIRGIVPLIFSLDHCGPMARTAEDVALLLNALAGYDPLDPSSVDHPQEDYVAALTQSTAQLRLGAPAEFYLELDSEVEAAVKIAGLQLSSLTAGIVSQDPLPSCGDLLDFLAETHSYHEQYLADSAGLYQPDTRAFLASFPSVTAVQYIRARQRLDELRRSIDTAFEDFDLVILPTERVLPFTIQESVAASSKAAESGTLAPQQMVTIANTYQFNMFGIPALTLPCGFSKCGLPIGLTIAGPRFSEGMILALAYAYQNITDWHTRSPCL